MNDKYYMLDCDSSPIATLNNIRDACPDSDWFEGKLFTCKVTEPFTVSVRSGHEYKLLEFYSDSMVMRSDLVDALSEAGVDNLQVYDLVIRNKEENEDYTNYKVVNIVGIVSAVDYEKTKFDPQNPSRLIDAGIDSLSIDANKARGLLMFRLKESITDIAIHESVKEHLEARREQFPYLRFIEPSDFKSL